MGLFRKFVNQTRKPEGVLGKLMVNGMNGGHAKLADWGMSFLIVNESDGPETHRDQKRPDRQDPSSE